MTIRKLQMYKCTQSTLAETKLVFPDIIIPPSGQIEKQVPCHFWSVWPIVATTAIFKSGSENWRYFMVISNIQGIFLISHLTFQRGNIVRATAGENICSTSQGTTSIFTAEFEFPGKTLPLM